MAQYKGNVQAASSALNTPRSTVQLRWYRARDWAKANGVDVPARETKAPHATPTTKANALSADEAWNELDRFIGRSRRVIETKPARKVDGVERIVIAGDFHAPFHEPELVADLIAREAKTADVLIVNGDLQDFYSISRFTKYEQMPVEAELAAVDALLGQLSRAFRRIVLVTGNHDRPRFEKQLRALLPAEVVHVVEYLAGGSLDVTAVMAKRYPNVEIARHAVGRHAVSWFYQHGDLITAHAEKFSRVPGSTLRGVHEWFQDRADILGLKPWRVLVQAHTHQLGLFPWLADQALVEGGCMCQTHGYQLDARVAGRPQRRGYVTLTQHDGRTDVNSIRLRWWDQAR